MSLSKCKVLPLRHSKRMIKMKKKRKAHKSVKKDMTKTKRNMTMIIIQKPLFKTQKKSLMKRF